MNKKKYNIGLVFISGIVLSISIIRFFADVEVDRSDYLDSFIKPNIRKQPLIELSESPVFRVTEEFNEMITTTEKIHSQLSIDLLNESFKYSNKIDSIIKTFNSINKKDSALLFFINSMILLSDSFFVADRNNLPLQSVFIIPRKKLSNFNFDEDTSHCLEIVLIDRENHPLPEIIDLKKVNEYLIEYNE